MAYIRKKTHKRKWRPSDEWPEHGTYYYVVESYRVEGKVRQATLAYLSIFPTVQEALAYDLALLEMITAGFPRWVERRDTLAEKVRNYRQPHPGVRQTWVHRELRALNKSIADAPGEIARLQEHIAALRVAADALGVNVEHVRPAEISFRRFYFVNQVTGEAATLTHNLKLCSA